MSKWIRNFIFFILMLILSLWIQKTNRKEVSGIKGDMTSYVMETPKLMKQAFGALIVIGAILFCGFFFLYLKRLGNVTIGHLNFAIVIVLIGTVSFIFSSNWKVVVQEEKMTLYSIFNHKKVIYISDINKVCVGKKGELEIYVSNIKIKTIDSLATNYDNFCCTLDKYGIAIE